MLRKRARIPRREGVRVFRLNSFPKKPILYVKNLIPHTTLSIGRPCPFLLMGYVQLHGDIVASRRAADRWTAAVINGAAGAGDPSVPTSLCSYDGPQTPKSPIIVLIQHTLTNVVALRRLGLTSSVVVAPRRGFGFGA